MILLKSSDWQEWYEISQTVVNAGFTIKDGIEEYRNEPDLNTALELARAIKYTQRAVQLGVALAAIDGPLPFGDVLGFGVAVVGSTVAWVDFFFWD